jgi:hypothetical protein
VKPHEHLLEIVTADWLTEGASVCNVVEELASQDWLLSNVSNRLLFSALLVPNGILLELVVLHNVFVIELLSGLNFLLEQITKTL